MLGAFFLLLAIYFYFSPQRYISVFLLFVLATACFQLPPLRYMIIPAMGISKTYDWVLLFTGVVALLRPQVFLNLPAWKSFKILTLYGAVLIALLFYSIYIQNVEVSVSIRVFRSLIYFITLFLFIPLTQVEIQKIFKLIIVVTSIVSLVYCLQLVLHKTLLNNVTSDYTVDGNELNDIVNRYYNLPVFIYPVIFFLFFQKKIFSIRYRPVLLLFNCAAILLSQHRNLLLAVIVCFFLHLLLTYSFKVRNLVFYSIVSIGLVIVADYAWGSRFLKGFQDISESSLDVYHTNFYEIKLNELTTTEFRQLLLLERLDFILKDNMSSIFGIGLLTDDSRKAANLNFNIGMSDGYGNVTQVASSDIVWSVLLLQLGLAGIFAFILFHLSLLKKFFSKRTEPFMQVGVLYIVCLLITSFYSNTIVLPYVTMLLMLFAAYYYNLSKRTFINNTDGDN